MALVLTILISQLTFPAVPASIPSELGDLSGLQNLQVIGNGAVPGEYYQRSLSIPTLTMTTRWIIKIIIQ